MNKQKITFHYFEGHSNLVLVQDHVGDTVDDWVLSFAVHTNQFAFHDVRLN